MRPWPVEVAAIFQSTSPVRGTTGLCTDVQELKSISIHVPREGDDAYTSTTANTAGDFNPRPP